MWCVLLFREAIDMWIHLIMSFDCLVFVWPLCLGFGNQWHGCGDWLVQPWHCQYHVCSTIQVIFWNVVAYPTAFANLHLDFCIILSKLGVPIKTTISATVLEEALNGTVTVRPLPLGKSVSGKVLLSYTFSHIGNFFLFFQFLYSLFIIRRLKSNVLIFIV